MTNVESPQHPASLTVEQALQQAIVHHQAGRLQDAERLYRSILQAQPNHPDANHNMGVLAVQMKQPAVGLPHFKAALEANPNQGQYWLSYMEALIQTGQIEAARQVLELGRQQGLQGEAIEALAGRMEESSGSEPGAQEINALAALFNEGRYTEAASLAQAMTVRFPLHGFAWKVLGAVFYQLGQISDALVAMQKAAALSPNDVEVHSNLGVTLKSMGRLDEAESSYRRALQIKPDFPDTHNNLGVTLKDMGRLVEAEASYRRALLIKPDFVDALNNLALLLNEHGKQMMALSVIKQSLQIKETAAAKGIYVACVERLSSAHADSEIRADMVRALTEPWGRPNDLARVGIDLIKLHPEIGGCVVRAANAWPVRLAAQDLLSSFKRS